jgi:hypothetical protein
MPAWIPILISIIQSAVKYAPDAKKIVEAAKELFAGLFGSKVIDAVTQNALCAHVEEFLDAFENGTPPPAWQVEPDPEEEPTEEPPTT